MVGQCDADDQSLSEAQPTMEQLSDVRLILMEWHALQHGTRSSISAAAVALNTANAGGCGTGWDYDSQALPDAGSQYVSQASRLRGAAAP